MAKFNRMARPAYQGPELPTEIVTEQAVAPRLPTKQSKVIELLLRDEGATLAELVEATGWQAHTACAALTGLKKKGHAVTSEKADGVRVYRLAQAAAR